MGLHLRDTGGVTHYIYTATPATRLSGSDCVSMYIQYYTLLFKIFTAKR